MTLLLALLGCTGNIQSNNTWDDDTNPPDLDDDGFHQGEDCDDDDPDVFPGAQELCDEVDQDCDDVVDENPLEAVTVYPDTDGDGFGDPSAVRYFCELPEGYSDNNLDCDDTNDAIHPDAQEVCDEGSVDEDCDDLVDDGDDSTDPESMQETFEDFDGDGYGNPDVSMLRCDTTSDWILDDTDCDDTNELATPENECDIGWMGVYTGTFEFVGESDVITDTCTGTAEVTMDTTGSPALTGTFDCTFAVVGVVTVTMDGELTGDNTMEGNVTVGDVTGVTWAGEFSEPGNLVGGGEGTAQVFGFEMTYTLTLDLTR